MQIIAGRFRGRRLQSPPGRQSRPTLSRVRAALFNILAPCLEGSSFLDLYAGAGSIGLEAYSRGCSRVVLVESDRVISKVLQQNLGVLDPGGREAVLLAREAGQAVQSLLQEGRAFDIIFLDPPYGGAELGRWALPGTLDRLLADGGWLILQHGKRDAVSDIWAGCTRQRVRTYGDTALSFFAKSETGNHAGAAGGGPAATKDEL